MITLNHAETSALRYVLGTVAAEADRMEDSDPEAWTKHAEAIDSPVSKPNDLFPRREYSARKPNPQRGHYEAKCVAAHLDKYSSSCHFLSPDNITDRKIWPETLQSCVHDCNCQILRKN